MHRNPIAPLDFAAKPISIWDKDWFLLSSGDFAARKFNSMTISWGSLGVMWGRPIAMVVVRPQRHTRKFMDECDNFTLCVFPPDQRKVLDVLGSKSGRDIDKINASGFTPQAASVVASPVYAEAKLAIECRKIYFHDFDPKHFLADYIQPMYGKDYHRMYFGEIVAVSGTDEYMGR